LDDFAAAVQESADLVQVDDNTYTVTVGKDAWPTPIPLSMKDGKWFFDTDAGLQQVLDRRIGENELAAIETCRAYALAQWTTTLSRLGSRRRSRIRAAPHQHAGPTRRLVLGNE